LSENTIFIQIAAYRDPELLPTLRNALETAKYPENLRFTIGWQHSTEDEWDNLDEFKEDSRFNILDIDYKDSKGVCWARNQVQQHYAGEKYTLQLDSHHRFIQHWDDELINMLEGLKSDGHAKPLLTAYIPSYDPKNDPYGRVMEPWWLTFDRFIPEGAIFFLPAVIPGWESMTKPIPSRFYSAHFCFTVGEFAVEVQHDPEYYFHGEEISIAVRAYTHGYDLFHPHKVIAWHEYTREGRTKHWDDDRTWGERNELSHRRNRILFEMDGLCSCAINFGKYGFGTNRILQDYERYAGLRFRTRGVQQYTLDNNFAPNPVIEDLNEYVKSFMPRFKHCIDLAKMSVPENDYEFWVVAFEDENGVEIIRNDADADEVRQILSTTDSYYKLWREFLTSARVSKWIVWPYSTSKGWCPKLEGHI
jgi:hypothetical protein